MKALDKLLFGCVLACDRKLSRAAIAIGIILVTYHNSRRGYAWPSVSTLAEKTGVDQSTVRRGIKQLVTADYFRVEEVGGQTRFHPGLIEQKTQAEQPRTQGRGKTKRSIRDDEFLQRM